jgi:hypothetical protein
MKAKLLGFVTALMILAIAGSTVTASAQTKVTTPVKAAPPAQTQAQAPAKTTTPAKAPAAALAGGTEKMMGPSIVGTYRLVSRKLANGKTLTAPDIQGMQTFTKTYRNFNVAWHDDAGKRFSYSVISEYQLTDKEYSETRLYSLMNDEIGVMPGMKAGAGPQYTMTSETKTAPVKMENGHLKFRLPFDPPEVDIAAGKFTATLPDGSVDTWEKVR